MTIKEYMGARGQVAPYLYDSKSGSMTPFGERHNTLSYFSAEAMAAAFGGDSSHVPAEVGFVFYPGDSLPADTRAAMDADIGRDQDWDKFIQDLKDVNADVLIVGFSYPPSLGSDMEYADVRNTITFHAVTNSQDGGSVNPNNKFAAGNYICQAVLLSRDSDKRNIIARVSLKDGENYLQKPDGFEVALDWTVIFK